MPYQQPRVPIGQRRSKLQLQQAVTTNDGMGGQTITKWQTIGSPWGQVIPLDERDKENLAGEKLTAKHAYHISIPFRSDLSVVQRVLYAGKTLELMTVVDDENRKRRLVLQCEEVQT